MNILLFLACTSFHQIGKLQDFSTQEERIKNAHRAVSLSHNDFIYMSAEKKSIALQTIGLLQVADQQTIDGTLDIIQHSSSSILRQQAIWSIGELGRILDWNPQSQNIHWILLDQLLKNPAPIEASLLVDAIIKTYCQHFHSTEDDVDTLVQIHAFLANTKSPPSTVFILQHQLQTLPVLITVLEKQLPTKNENAIYTSAFELMRFLVTNQEQLMTAHVQYQNLLQEGFSVTEQVLQQASPKTQTMLLSFLQTILERPPLSSYMIQKMISLEQELTPSNRLLLFHCLYSMLEEENARQYFRENWLQQPINASQLAWINRAEYRSLDIIQQIYGIRQENK